MAATATILETWEGPGNKQWYKGTIALDSSYPTGGEAIDPALNERFGWMWIQGGGTTATGLGYIFNFVVATQSVLVVWGNAGTASVLPEVTNTTDLSALTAVPFVAISD